MNKRIGKALGIGVVLLGGVCLTAPAALGSTCADMSSTWTETNYCPGNGGGTSFWRGYGFGYFTPVGMPPVMNKSLYVLLGTGTANDSAVIQGVDINGAFLASCLAQDQGPVDLIGATDTSGCNSAVKYYL